MAIHRRSGGIPRTISVICDNGLLTAYAEGVAQVSASLVEAVCRDEHVERCPAHVLHHNEIDARGRLQLVNRDDVRVIDRRKNLCLVQKAPPALLVHRTVSGKDFDRDVAAEARVARSIDLAHAAGTQQ